METSWELRASPVSCRYFVDIIRWQTILPCLNLKLRVYANRTYSSFRVCMTYFSSRCRSVSSVDRKKQPADQNPISRARSADSKGLKKIESKSPDNDISNINHIVAKNLCDPPSSFPSIHEPTVAASKVGGKSRNAAISDGTPIDG